MGITSVTKKGQVTIPVAVRRALHIKPKDRVEICIEGDGATIKKIPDVGELQGSISVPKRLKGADWKDIGKKTHKAIGKGGAR